MGLAKAGITGYFFPSSVISGMLAGIGIIIFIKQIPHALGYDQDYEGDLSFFQGDGYNTFSELSHILNFITPGALIIAIVSLLILILWDLPVMQKKPDFQAATRFIDCCVCWYTDKPVVTHVLS